MGEMTQRQMIEQIIDQMVEAKKQEAAAKALGSKLAAKLKELLGPIYQDHLCSNGSITTEAGNTGTISQAVSTSITNWEAVCELVFGGNEKVMEQYIPLKKTEKRDPGDEFKFIMDICTKEDMIELDGCDLHTHLMERFRDLLTNLQIDELEEKLRSKYSFNEIATELTALLPDAYKAAEPVPENPLDYWQEDALMIQIKVRTDFLRNWYKSIHPGEETTDEDIKQLVRVVSELTSRKVQTKASATEKK